MIVVFTGTKIIFTMAPPCGPMIIDVSTKTPRSCLQLFVGSTTTSPGNITLSAARTDASFEILRMVPGLADGHDTNKFNENARVSKRNRVSRGVHGAKSGVSCPYSSPVPQSVGQRCWWRTESTLKS